MLIRHAADGDKSAILVIMEPIIGAGETYALPRDMEKKTALAYWLSPEHEGSSLQKRTAKLSAPIFCNRISRVAEHTLRIVGT